VLPAISGQQSHPDPEMKSTPLNRLNIPGFRDDAVEEYCNWQKSQNKRPELKLEYQKACDVIIKRGSDLELIRRNPNPKFLINADVLEGVAEHVIGDINY
jgi:hypothetical protein